MDLNPVHCENTDKLLLQVFVQRAAVTMDPKIEVEIAHSGIDLSVGPLNDLTCQSGKEDKPARHSCSAPACGQRLV